MDDLYHFEYQDFPPLWTGPDSADFTVVSLGDTSYLYPLNDGLFPSVEGAQELSQPSHDFVYEVVTGSVLDQGVVYGRPIDDGPVRDAVFARYRTVGRVERTLAESALDALHS